MRFVYLESNFTQKQLKIKRNLEKILKTSYCNQNFYLIYFQKTIVFDTNPLNTNLRGFSWIFKFQNLCYNQCVIKLKVHEFLELNEASNLPREIYYMDKAP